MKLGRVISFVVVLLLLCGCDATEDVNESTLNMGQTTIPTITVPIETEIIQTEIDMTPTKTGTDLEQNTSRTAEEENAEKTTIDLTGEYQYIKIREYTAEGFWLSWYCGETYKWSEFEYYAVTTRPWFGGYGDWYCNVADPDWYVYIYWEETYARVMVHEASRRTVWGGDRIPLA